MKLIEIQLRDKVPTGAPGDTTARLSSAASPNPASGWAMTLETGMVTARKGDVTLLIPMGNVAYMRPEAAPAKAEKPGPKAA